jgi:hypothetical protein
MIFASKQIQRINNFALAALLVLSTITASVPFIFSQSASAVAPTSTVTVNGDTAAAENSPGWLFNRDATTATPFNMSGSVASTDTGSLFVQPIGANPSDKFVGELFLSNQQIADTNSISYDFNVASGNATAYKQFYANVYANYGTSAPDKYYDCRYNVVPSAVVNGVFSTVTFEPSSDYNVSTRSGSAPCPASPADMGTGATIRAFVINVGDTTTVDTGVSGYFDNVIVNTTSSIIAYDFEPLPVAVPANIRLTKDSNNAPIATGSTVNYSDITMKWNTVPNAERYQIRVTDPAGATQANRYTGWYTFDLSDAIRHGFFGTQQGEWQYEVRTKDATSGLWSPYSTPLTLTFDSQKPTAVLTSPTTSVFTNGSNLVIHAEDNLGLKRVVANVYKTGVAGVFKPTQAPAGSALTFDHTVSLAGLADGSYYVKFNATDNAGNVSSTSTFNFTLDTTAPNVPTNGLPNGAYQNTASGWNYTWSDESATGAVRYEYQASQTPALTSGIWNSVANGNSSQNPLLTPQIPSVGTSDGTWYWQVRSIDAYGNTSAWSTIWNVTVDTIAPEAPVVTATDIALNDSTNNPSVEINWTAPTGAVKYDYRVWTNIAGSGFTSEATAYPANNLTVNSRSGAFSVGEGTYYVQVRAYDAAGNVSDWSETFAVTYDNTAPTVSIDAVTPNAATISGTVDEDATVEVTINGEVYTVESVEGVWTMATPELADGIYSVSVTATDAAKNETSPAVVTSLKIDTTDPTVAIITEDALTSNQTPAITGTYTSDAYNDTIVTLSIDEGTALAVINNGDGTWSYTPATALDEGAHTFVATASDAVGNSTVSNTVTLTIDSIAPELAIVATTSNGNTPTFSGSAELGAVLSVTFNGVTTEIENNDGTWTFTSPTALENGTYAFSITAFDEAGNPTTLNSNVIVAVVAPSTTPIFTVAPAAINPGAATVLGATTDNAAAESGTANVAGATDDKTAAAVDSEANQGTIFGIAWYWWILILAALASIGWFIAAAIRRRNEEKA